MKSILSLLPILLILNAAQAQIKIGYKHLKDKKYEAAISVFEQNLNQPKYAIGAHYGLALAYEKDNKNHRSLLSALHHANMADSLLKRSGKKVVSTPGGKLTAYSYESFSTRHARPTWDLIKKNNGSFKEADQLRVLVPNFFTKFRNSENVAPHLKVLVNQAVQASSDYATLSSIAKNYEAFIEKTALGNTGDLGHRLFEAFHQEHGPNKIRRFLEDHPRHWANRDCWKEEFIVAYEKNELAALLAFLRSYPDSYIGAILMLKDINTRFSPFSREAKALNETDKKYFSCLRKWNELRFQSSRATLPDREELVQTLRQLGNGWHSFFLLFDYVNGLIEQKNWDDAAWILSECEGLILNVAPPQCNFIYELRAKKVAELKKILMADEQKLAIRELDELNTSGNEIVPFITPDGKFLYFTGEGRPDNFKGEDTYRVPISPDGKFGIPELMLGLAGDKNESLLSINFEGNEAMVYLDGILHRSRMTAKGWSTPEQVNFPRERFSWVGKATVNLDGTALIFEAKEKQELYYSENIDLFVCLQQPNKQWGQPFPISNRINTILRERSPYLHIDGKTLYFSSNGLYGLGGMDVFKTDRLDDTWKNWSEPQNMGKFINTPDDDWGMSFIVSADGRTAFFSKDVNERRGELMCIGLPERLRPKAIKVVEVPVRASTPVSLNVMTRNNEVIYRITAIPGTPVRFLAEAENEYLIIALSGEGNFGEPVIADLGNTPEDAVVQTSTIVSHNVKDLISSKEKFQIAQVQFPKSESVLTPQAMIALEGFMSMTKGKYKIKVTGHTDDVGNEKANQLLSEQRADAVKAFLVKCRYPEHLIQTEGKGKSSPRVPNSSEVNRAINRRVEFEFLD